MMDAERIAELKKSASDPDGRWDFSSHEILELIGEVERLTDLASMRQLENLKGQSHVRDLNAEMKRLDVVISCAYSKCLTASQYDEHGILEDVINYLSREVEGMPNE